MLGHELVHVQHNYIGLREKYGSYFHKLSELEAYIKEYKHLPGIPTKAEIDRDGQNLGAIQAKLLEKIEELTLIAINQQKEIEQLKQKLTNVNN